MEVSGNLSTASSYDSAAIWPQHPPYRRASRHTGSSDEDGAVLLSEILYQSVNNPTNGIAVSNSSTQVLTGLTPGSRTFELYFSADVPSGTNAAFSSNALAVWPL